MLLESAGYEVSKREDLQMRVYHNTTVDIDGSILVCYSFSVRLSTVVSILIPVLN